MPPSVTLPNLRLISVIPGSSGIRPAPRRFRDALEAHWTSGHLPPSETPLIPYNVLGCGRRQRERRFRCHVELGGEALASQRVWQTLLTTSRTRVRSAAGPHRGCCSPCTHRTTASSEGLVGSWHRTHRRPVDSWLCTCSGNLGGPGAAASAIRPQARSGCRPSTAGIDPAGCGKRIERCPQVQKRAPVRVHGCESVREPTTVTLAEVATWGRRIRILACGESGSQIRAMSSKIREMCSAARAFPPNST